MEEKCCFQPELLWVRILKDLLWQLKIRYLVANRSFQRKLCIWWARKPSCQKDCDSSAKVNPVLAHVSFTLLPSAALPSFSRPRSTIISLVAWTCFLFMFCLPTPTACTGSAKAMAQSWTLYVVHATQLIIVKHVHDTRLMRLDRWIEWRRTTALVKSWPPSGAKTQKLNLDLIPCLLKIAQI